MNKTIILIATATIISINSCFALAQQPEKESVELVVHGTSTSKITKKMPFNSPFNDHEAFIKFMNGSKSWSEHALRTSFPKTLYDSCLDPEQTQFLEVLYQSPNGITRGWTIRPKGDNQKLPIVVFNRGGFAKWGRIFPFELFSLCRVAKQGFMVIASDFRGLKNGHGKQDKTDLGYGDVNDGFYLIDAIKKEYTDLDTSNIAVWGFSRGTTLAVKMATQSNTIRLIILQGMVADLINNQRRDEFDTHVYPLLVDDWATLPRSEQNKLLSGIDPLSLINQIKGKPNFLILHGAKDTRTSPQDALVYASKLLNLNYSVAFHLYPNSKHVLSADYDSYINEVISSLNQHM